MPPLLRSLGDALAQTIWATILGVMVIAIAPIWAAVAGAPGYLIFTLVLVALASALVIIPKLSAILRGTNNTAFIRLHIHADERQPDKLHTENIFRFYQLRNVLLAPLAEGGLAQGASTTMFVTFENDVEITSIEVSSPDMVLPVHEVKEYNQRYAIICFAEFLPGGTLEVRAGF
jgi:hypothetical protein